MFNASPRFGKTISIHAIAKELRCRLTVFTSYVKTTETSTRNNLMWEQFADVVFINLETENYEERILTTLEEGKSVVTFLSLYKGGQRQKRLDFLKRIPTKKLFYVDEADFGVHREGQLNPLLSAVKDDDYLIFGTGTNPDYITENVTLNWVESINYIQLLNQKEKTRRGEQVILNGLVNFKHDPNLDLLYPHVVHYQMDIRDVILAEMKAKGIKDTEDLYSWGNLIQNFASNAPMLTQLFVSL